MRTLRRRLSLCAQGLSQRRTAPCHALWRKRLHRSRQWHDPHHRPGGDREGFEECRRDRKRARPRHDLYRPERSRPVAGARGEVGSDRSGGGGGDRPHPGGCQGAWRAGRHLVPDCGLFQGDDRQGLRPGDRHLRRRPAGTRRVSTSSTGSSSDGRSPPISSCRRSSPTCRPRSRWACSVRYASAG